MWGESSRSRISGGRLSLCSSHPTESEELGGRNSGGLALKSSIEVFLCNGVKFLPAVVSSPRPGKSVESRRKPHRTRGSTAVAGRRMTSNGEGSLVQGIKPRVCKVPCWANVDGGARGFESRASGRSPFDKGALRFSNRTRRWMHHSSARVKTSPPLAPGICCHQRFSTILTSLPRLAALSF